MLSNTTFIDPATLYIILAVVIFILQLILIIKAKKVIIKLTPTILSLLSFCCSLILYFIGEGWNQIGYLFLTICSFILFIMCSLSVTCYFIIVKIRNKK